jgi:hypothetical protein
MVSLRDAAAVDVADTDPTVCDIAQRLRTLEPEIRASGM